MLGMKSNLYFPFLEFVREDVQIRPASKMAAEAGCEGAVNRKIEIPRKERPTRIYRLDWESFDEKKHAQFLDWCKRCGHDHERFPFAVSLPEPYESEVKGYLFALSGGYKAEIIRNAQRAREEWSIARPFDSVICEGCVKPAIEHAKVAFFLLSDCIWDPETKYWRRDRIGPLSTSLMAYRFWLNQTGNGMVWYHAGFASLNRQFTLENKDKYTVEHARYLREDACRKVQTCVQAINEIETRRSEEHNKAFAISRVEGERIEAEEVAASEGMVFEESQLDPKGDGRPIEPGQKD